MRRYFLFSVVIISIISCNPKIEETKLAASNTLKEESIPYDLMNPEIVYHLPSYLKEISGISYYKKNKIACIQDERAIIYIYDIPKKKITSKFDFGKNNDYEDIALVDDTFYILRSDGNIFKLKNIDTLLYDDDNGSVKKLFIETAKKLNLTSGDNIFYPSGLAIHPFDDETIYVISSIGKLLLTINRNGKILDIIKLDKNIFNQPEGICFSKEGDMFISNEGKNGGGNIVKFNLIKDSYNIK